jgi:hypothetical protein
MVLVPDFEREPGPKCLAQQTLKSSPVRGTHLRRRPPRPARRRPWRGGVLRTFVGRSEADARGSSPYRPRRNTAASGPRDLDVGEDAVAERYLLPNPDGLRRHALVEVVEKEVVAADALKKQAELAGSVFHDGRILPRGRSTCEARNAMPLRLRDGREGRAGLHLEAQTAPHVFRPRRSARTCRRNTSRDDLIPRA